MVIVILILSKKYKNDVTGGGNVDKYEVVKFVLKMAKNDNLHMEFGVVQKMLSYTTEMVLIFATIPKCSNLFLFDRHHTECVWCLQTWGQNNCLKGPYHWNYLPLEFENRQQNWFFLPEKIRSKLKYTKDQETISENIWPNRQAFWVDVKRMTLLNVETDFSSRKQGTVLTQQKAAMNERCG